MHDILYLYLHVDVVEANIDVWHDLFAMWHARETQHHDKVLYKNELDEVSVLATDQLQKYKVHLVGPVSRTNAIANRLLCGCGHCISDSVVKLNTLSEIANSASGLQKMGDARGLALVQTNCYFDSNVCQCNISKYNMKCMSM
jgi:hypothetical protein